MSSYYPDGSNTKDAPWNQTEPKMTECDACGGSGYSGHDCGEDTCCCAEPKDNLWCCTCEGSGEVECEDDDG